MPRKITPESARRSKIRAIRRAVHRLQIEIASRETPPHRVAPLSRALNESVDLLLKLEGVQVPEPPKGRRGRPYGKSPKSVERDPATGNLVAVYVREGKQIRITVPDSVGLSGLSREAAGRLTHDLLEAHVLAAASALGAPAPVVPAMPPVARKCAPLLDIHTPDCECTLDCGCLRRNVEDHLLGGEHRPDCPTRTSSKPEPAATPPPLTPRAYSETLPVPEEAKVTEVEPEAVRKPEAERIYPKPTATFDPGTGFGLRLTRK